MTLLSAIVPCRNERHYVDAFCAGALAQRLPEGWTMELLIADGQSNDGTRQRLEAIVAEDARVRFIDNPDRTVSAGLNRALAAARGEVIVRLDVHTQYASNYIAQCLAALQESGADNVGGPWRAEAEPGGGPVQQAIAAAFRSRWVAGGAASRRLDYSGWVDTVYLGCWPRASFERFGGFDEALVRNQDDEHNLRIVRGGGRVWQSAAVRSVYRPRATLAQAWGQYVQYGYWKPFVMKKHGQAAALRQLLPTVLVAAALLALLLAVLGEHTPLVAWCVVYGAMLLALTASVARQRPGPAALLRVPAVIAAYHLAYGWGSLLGWYDVLRQRPPRERFTVLTR